MKNILTFNSFKLNENSNTGVLDLDYINSKLNDKKFINKIRNVIDSLSPRMKRSLLNFLTNTKVLDLDKMLKYFKLILKSKTFKNKNKLDENEFIEEISSELDSKNESFLGIAAGVFVFIGMAFISIAAATGVVAILINAPEHYDGGNTLFGEVVITIIGLILIAFLSSISYLAGAGALSVFGSKPIHMENDSPTENITIDVKIDNEKVKLKLTKDEQGNYKVEEIK